MQTTEPVTEQFGRLTVITWTDAEGISINAFTAGTRNSGLSAVYPHTEREAAKAWYRTIRDSALAGTPAWLIEAEVAALIDASQVVNAAEQAMVEGINANMDAAQPKPADVSDIVPRGPGSWQALRRSHTRKAKVTTEAMDRILDSATTGYIPRSGQATSRQLIALKDRGLVELDWQWIGRERAIVGAWLAGHRPQKVAA